MRRSQNLSIPHTKERRLEIEAEQRAWKEAEPLVKRSDGKLTAEDILNMLVYRKAGMDNNSIAEIFDVHPQTVTVQFRKLKDRGFDVPESPSSTRKTT